MSSPAQALVILGHGKAHLLFHVHSVLAGTSLNEGPVKEVTIVGDIHTWFHLQCVRADQSCHWLAQHCQSHCPATAVVL